MMCLLGLKLSGLYTIDTGFATPRRPANGNPLNRS
jgi:hypothetical protein